MDHSHHDRTYKKSRFQQELEQSVSRKLISSLLLGCLLFCIAIAAVNALNQNARREDHLESVASTFHEVYDNTSAFLLDAGHTELFLSELRKDQDNLRYLISHYNVSALVEIQLILTDSKGNVRFTTFSEGEMNLHRQEFNGIAVDNACHLMRAVYTTVYHFRANSSEYVMIHPLYRDGEYQGAAAVYLNENDWTKLFSQYQYDAILTKPNGDVIACSNSSFLSQKNANKYLPADAAQYVRVNGNRYLRSSRSLENGTVLAYSFIYSPTNYSYLLVGLLLIVLLGLSWAAMFVRIMHAMTEQMVKSVDTLVRQIRIIRKGIRYSVPWEECGCSVVGEAENGAAGEEKIAELQPDIVITDITMPVKNGLEMIADTREKFNYIAIILTGYSEFEYAQQAIRNGVSDYVLKPLDMDEMRTALEKAVRLAGDNQYLQQREDEAEAVRSRTALPPLSEDKVTDPLVLRIVAYLKENYRSKITLADLQEQFHYSERYINQKFQKELGTTVIDYLNRCRIQNALELIRKGKLPISQIGWECGIGEYKYFNHVFKKYIGCSVREYQSTLK